MEHPKLVAGLVGILATFAGAVIGWGANSLTMTGRVAALEAGMLRIEAMVTTILTSNTIVIRKEGVPKP